MLCKIVDFDLFDDGLFGINVEGVCCVSVGNIKIEVDGLWIGDCIE